jgi:hypothetical protein
VYGLERGLFSNTKTELGSSLGSCHRVNVCPRETTVDCSSSTSSKSAAFAPLLIRYKTVLEYHA